MGQNLFFRPVRRDVEASTRDSAARKGSFGAADYASVRVRRGEGSVGRGATPRRVVRVPGRGGRPANFVEFEWTNMAGARFSGSSSLASGKTDLRLEDVSGKFHYSNPTN